MGCSARRPSPSLLGMWQTRQSNTEEPTRRPGAFLCLHTPSANLPPPPRPPSFLSVRNLYFISELWSSSAQLSADKAQEALQRRHGYLDGEGGEEGRRGELENERQAGTQTPQGHFALATLFFFPSFPLFSFLSLADSLPPSLPPSYLSGRVQLVPAAASTRSPAQPGSRSLYQHTPTTRKAESN